MWKLRFWGKGEYVNQEAFKNLYLIYAINMEVWSPSGHPVDSHGARRHDKAKWQNHILSPWVFCYICFHIIHTTQGGYSTQDWTYLKIWVLGRRVEIFTVTLSFPRYTDRYYLYISQMHNSSLVPNQNGLLFYFFHCLCTYWVHIPII